MEDQQLEKIWWDVKKETYDRSGGSFKRALWYGNNSMIMGQNKGMRKALRNAPRTIATAVIGKGLDALPLPPGTSDLLNKGVDAALNKGKDIYSDRVKPLIRGNEPMSIEEGLRKNIKKDVKSLQGDAFLVIDRNLVKMKDAKKKVSPAIQNLMASSGPNATEEQKLQKAHNALRAVAEAEYYVDKVARLVYAIDQATTRLRDDLDKYKEATVKTRNELSNYIKELV